jgi:hypothetical protein
MKNSLLLLLWLFAGAGIAQPIATTGLRSGDSGDFEDLEGFETLEDSEDSADFATLVGVWVLDSAIITQTGEDGAVVNTSVYLQGDTVFSFVNGYNHPQPPQKVVFTADSATFEYSSPISCRNIAEQYRTGQYALRLTPEGRTLLRICFRFYEEFICVRNDDRNLQLHYLVYLSDERQQYKEIGVFKFKLSKL